MTNSSPIELWSLGKLVNPGTNSCSADSWSLGGGPLVERAFSGRINRCKGDDLHSDVPATHWCVTKEDVSKLRLAVRRAIDDGHIRPTKDDPFDPADNIFGPNVHTVVHQMLKPVESMIGGASWALLQHPTGLECDLFVTHGWLEGMFEFIDKLTYSWPPGRKHAWCCMLSNPQSLDLETMVSNPSSSPFAQALASASCILVVPNRHGSVFQRVWCTYEAYLALRLDKTVLIASAPLPRKCWQEAFFMLMISMIFACLNYVFVDWHIAIRYHTALNFLMALSILLHPSAAIANTLVNMTGIVLSGSLTGLLVKHPDCSDITAVCVKNTDAEEDSFLIISGVCRVLLFVISQLDHRRYIHFQKESGLLQSGYSGSVRDANATKAQDKSKILQEIWSTSDESHVDQTIAVLLRSGMCTPSLRIAWEHGVDISAVGMIFYKHLAVGAYTIAIYIQQTFVTSRSVTLADWSAVLLFFACLAIWLSRLVASFGQRDQSAYIARVAWKFVGLPALLYLVMLNISWLAFGQAVSVLVGDGFREIILPFFCCCAASLSMMNFGTLASVPMVGARLAQVLAANDVLSTLTAPFKRVGVSRMTVQHRAIELSAVGGRQPCVQGSFCMQGSLVL